MKNQKIITATIAVLVIAVTFGSVALSPAADAQEEVTPFPSREKTISVTGTATTKVQPDLVNIQFGVETQEATAKQALEANSALMNTVIAAIKKTGVSESEISTSSLTIYPVYDHYEDKTTGLYTQELIGYRVSNVITVKTKNLDLAAPIIDGAVASGANRVDSVYFTLSEETHLKIKDDLIGKAVANAKSKAEKALGPLDHKIIGVKAVSLSEFAIPYPIPMYKATFDYAEAASMPVPTPVFTSNQDVTTSASVVFIIGSN
jgi:uncharacterized protein